MAGDDLMGLAVVVVIAGGAFYLLTQKGNFNLGPAEADPNDPGFTEGDTGTGPQSSTATGRCKSLYAGSCCIECKQPTSSACTKCKSVCGANKANCASSTGKINCADGHTCGERCAKGWCTSYRGCCNSSNHPGGCAACGVGGRGGASVTNCQDLCSRRECSSYYKLCSKTGCTQCNWAHECAAGNCESGHTYDDTCKIGGKLCPPLSAYARSYRSYTGRVTFNESTPIQNPNSIPMNTNINGVPKPAMRARWR